MSGIAGKRILVTRPRAQAADLVEKLSQAGAVPVVFPTIEIVSLAENAPLDRAISALQTFRWVIFTSVNGVEGFWQRLAALNIQTPAAFQGVHVAAIGPATARALNERGVPPNFVPEEYIAEAILPGLGDVSGQRILLPRAEIARKNLFETLVQKGALPEEIPVYQTAVGRPTRSEWADFERGVDAAAFTSSSTVRNFLELLGREAVPKLGGAVVACIGPVTADTARACGFSVGLVAEEYTMAGLVEALDGYFRNHSSTANGQTPEGL